MSYHVPVLLKESVDALIVNDGGLYLDATFGGGGHSKKILELLNAKGRLIGFDQDEEALANTINDERFLFVLSNFRHIKRYLRLHGIGRLDGILADLGVSSHQLDEARRGFAFRLQGALDMRMDARQKISAADVLNDKSERELLKIFSDYGEVRNAKTLSKAIVERRRFEPFSEIDDFVSWIQPLVRGKPSKYLAQVFQALRIEVNEEVEALKAFLKDGLDLLKPGGRFVVISYHSIEDRLVKRFFKSGQFDGRLQSDDYGNIYRPFARVSKKIIKPNESEVKENSRARSAILRWAEKGSNG